MHKILDLFSQTFVFIASLQSLCLLNSSPANARVAGLPQPQCPSAPRGQGKNGQGTLPQPLLRDTRCSEPEARRSKRHRSGRTL